jgi:hypothetical protein
MFDMAANNNKLYGGWRLREEDREAIMSGRKEDKRLKLCFHVLAIAAKL